MAKTKAQRSRLANALVDVKKLRAENDLREAILAQAREMIDLQAARLQRAASVLRSAADQFEVREANDTAQHLRAEADVLDPRAVRIHGGMTPGLRNTLRELATSCA